MIDVIYENIERYKKELKFLLLQVNDSKKVNLYSHHQKMSELSIRIDELESLKLLFNSRLSK